MRKKIAFYISDHNMEHALRTISIIQNILKLEDLLQVVVKSGLKQVRFMESFLGSSERLAYYSMEMKDREIGCWDELIENEMEFLREQQIGLVVSDICPWILVAADELRIKGILIGNYTWADLCESEEDTEEYLSCYELASRMFIYDFHTPEMTEYGVEYDLISMVNRPYNMKKIERLPFEVGGSYIFVDMPGIEERDVSDISYPFVVTEGTHLYGKNVTVLSDGEKSFQDYIAASGYVIARASWNRIAEVVLANRKAAFVADKDIPMSEQMIDLLAEREQCIKMEEQELMDNIAGTLKKLEEFEYSYDYEYYNGDYDLAKRILFSYPEKRRRTRS